MRASAVAKNWPPVSRAMSCSVSRSGGTFSVLTAPVFGSVCVSVPFCDAQRHGVDRDLVLLGLLDDVDRVLAARARTPSPSSTIAAGSRRSPPSPSGIGTRAELIASFSASPIAVAPATCSELIVVFTRAWSVVGSASCCAARAEADDADPELVRHGLSTNALPAACAAASRDGCTSVASIEPDVSKTSMTVASRRSAATVRCGRASAISSAASASSASTAGRWRVHERPATATSRSTFV